jgi:serine/threonine protein phosphatase PrpC
VLIDRAFRLAGETLRAELDEDGYYGTTYVILLLLRDGRAHISWLGDCLAHRISGAEIVLLAWPHTIREVMRRRGTLTAELEQQNPAVARVLLHFLGGELPDPLEVVSFTPDRGDRLILTTDGVHDVLPPSELFAACQSHPAPQACADRLVSLAIERGSRDNCTSVVIAFE